MTVRLLVSCDRTRSGQPCRAYLPVELPDDDTSDALLAARQSAVDAGWTLDDDLGGDRCPSPGHDAEESR